MFQNASVTNNLKHTIIPPRDVKAIPRYEIGLMIHNVQNEDFGNYDCYVINQYGIEYARIPLIKRSKALGSMNHKSMLSLTFS